MNFPVTLATKSDQHCRAGHLHQRHHHLRSRQPSPFDQLRRSHDDSAVARHRDWSAEQPHGYGFVPFGGAAGVGQLSEYLGQLLFGFGLEFWLVLQPINVTARAQKALTSKPILVGY
jgi:hypothetical protein